MDFKEIGQSGVDWTVLAQDRDNQQAILNPVMNIRVS